MARYSQHPFPMSIRVNPSLWLVPSLALAAGACSNTPAHLSVKGTVQVDGGGTTTGFDFPNDTRLDDDRVASPDGNIAGHCTIKPGSGGVPDVVSVGVVRPNPPAGDLGAHSFVARADAAGGGQVTTIVGSDTFMGMGGGSCVVQLSYLDVQGRVAGVNVECDVASDAGATARLSAQLDFSGCTVSN